jgi:GT2 family glycosyltransferase
LSDASAPRPFPADVGVSIVCHNNRGKLGSTLAALEAAGCPHAAIKIIDIASTDGTVNWLCQDFPGIEIRTLDRNDGPNPARNVGVRESRFPYVFLMDADIRVQPETIQRLRAAMAADSSVAIASPIVVHADDPETIQYAEGSLHFICEAINPWFNGSLAKRGPAPRDVGVASTCGLLLDRASAIDVGLFDERYFMGKDDGDFTHRMRIAGRRILEVPSALLLHEQRPRSTWLFYYQLRNRWHFMLKNYQLSTLLLILPALAIHEPMQALVLHVKGYGLVYWKAVGGLIRMLPALPRDRAAVRRLRVLPDAVLLRADSLVIREDLASHPLVRLGKRAYEGWLRWYWSLLQRTVLAGARRTAGRAMQARDSGS